MCWWRAMRDMAPGWKTLAPARRNARPSRLRRKSSAPWGKMWNEEAYQLLLDVYTLDKLLQVLPDKSLRAQRVAAALQAFTDIADFELPPEERRESFIKAREALRDAMACHNGSTAPLMWLIGQSHIDLAWLWPMEETYHKMVRTYSNQMTLLDEYPGSG